MTLSGVVTLPVSGVNIGLAASPIGLNAKVTRLNAEIAQLGLALTGQAQFSANFPPNIPGYALAATAALNPANLVSAFNPANIVTLGADANADATVKLGLVDGQIEIVEALTADFTAGLNTGGITGFTYAGDAAGYGIELNGATRNGFPGAAPEDHCDAIIIGCANFSSWGGFSRGFQTGGTANTDLGSTTKQRRFAAQGSRTGGQWSFGLSGVLQPIDLLLLELQGAKATLEAQIALSLGLNLPDPSVVVDLGLAVDLEAALGSITVSLDLDGQIDGINLQIAAILDLIGSISADLSGGGLNVWFYSGPVAGLGGEFEPVVQQGLPGTTTGASGSTYGLVLAAASPSAWASFGKIFKTS